MRPEAPGFVAPWELRAGDLRVYYEVERPEKRVCILAIGLKVRERILFGGKGPGDER